MSNFWLKFKVWTKVTLIVAVLIYAIIFVSKNSERTVKLWVFFNRDYERSVIVLMLMCLAIGIVGTLLVRTTLRTIRQVSELRARGKVIRTERELADMKAKASKLQTRPDGIAAAAVEPIEIKDPAEG